jgi:hypothetical protein
LLLSAQAPGSAAQNNGPKRASASTHRNTFRASSITVIGSITLASMKKTAAAPCAAISSARAAGGLPKATKALPVPPKKAAPAPAAATVLPPRPVPTNADEMKVELMHCVQVTWIAHRIARSCARAHLIWQESKFKEALRWSVNILKLEPSNAVISEYQVTCGA